MVFQTRMKEKRMCGLMNRFCKRKKEFSWAPDGHHLLFIFVNFFFPLGTHYKRKEGRSVPKGAKRSSKIEKKCPTDRLEEERKPDRASIKKEKKDARSGIVHAINTKKEEV